MMTILSDRPTQPAVKSMRLGPKVFGIPFRGVGQMKLRLVVVVPIVLAVATSALAQTQRRKTQKSRSSPSAPATGLARHLPPPDWDRCVEKIRPSVVRVSWKKDEQQGRSKKETEMIGSGFAGGEGTPIVTNNHRAQR